MQMLNHLWNSPDFIKAMMCIFGVLWVIAIIVNMYAHFTIESLSETCKGLQELASNEQSLPLLQTTINHLKEQQAMNRDLVNINNDLVAKNKLLMEQINRAH